MERLTLVFPIALILFIMLLFSEFISLLKKEGGIAEQKSALDRKDAGLIIALCAVYGLAAFINLGIFTAPQSFCKFDSKGEYALIELKDEQEIGAVMYYSGLYSGSYRLQFSADGENWLDQESMEQKHADLFKWQYAKLSEENPPVRFLRIIAGGRLWLGELAVYDGGGRLLDSSEFSLSGGTAQLFDEQNTVPEKPDYLNSAYFDEIYHARTAYEHEENIYPYEISHPPLGKLIINLGIKLFGMVPFGWRFMGALFGVLMLPLMYAFGKKLFGSRETAFCLSAVFAFDFMHFVQTRIATIDTYGVFFTIAMYLFMYVYLQSDRQRKKSWLPPLMLSGLSFGLGAACKWTCLYAGAGLGLIWLIDRIERFRAEDREKAKRELWENVGFCLIFFVLIPCTVYYLSYYPYGRALGMEGLSMFFEKDYAKTVLDNQRFMLTYHSGVKAEHPYSSRWWQWLLDIRPILYYLEYLPDGRRSSFGAFLSPLLCWAGLAAVLCMAWLSIFKKDRTARFILIGYLAQLLPWVFIGRITFAYHYFPCSVFLALALGYVFETLRRRSSQWRLPVYSFTAASLLLFGVFYPVLSGAVIKTEYAAKFLRWLGTWPF